MSETCILPVFCTCIISMNYMCNRPKTPQIYYMCITCGTFGSVIYGQCDSATHSIIWAVLLTNTQLPNIGCWDSQLPSLM